MVGRGHRRPHFSQSPSREPALDPEEVVMCPIQATYISLFIVPLLKIDPERANL